MIFLNSCLIPGGKYHIVMARSLLERIVCDVISLKAERQLTLKHCTFTSFINSIISAKFEIYQLTLTLFSGSSPKRPPVADEI